MSDPTFGRDPVEELAEEFTARYLQGEHPSLSDYADKYPQLVEQIREVLHALISRKQSDSRTGAPTRPFPLQVGEAGTPPQQLGDYRILREVGRGGMGVVYEAVQESLGRHVALKILPFHRLMDPTHLHRFRREARAAAQLHHTNIVPVFGVGEAEGIHYYAMQFIQGQALDGVLQAVRRLRSRKEEAAVEAKPAARDLSSSIAQGLLTGHFQEVPCEDCPPLEEGALGCQGEGHSASRSTLGASGAAPPATKTATGTAEAHAGLASQTEWQYCRSVAQVGVQVAEALAYAHKQRVLHRDIKPSNLLLDTRGTVWITDFGLAKAEGSEDLTGPGDIVGTLRFMAPERFQGRAEPASDVYSLGITLYEMLTLRPAFSSSDRARLVERVLQEEPPRPRALDPHIPRDLETIVRKAMAKEPSHRYPSALDLAQDLRRFLNSEPIHARPVGQVERLWRWCRRNPGLAGALSAAAFFLLVGILVSSLLAVQARAEAKRAEDNEGLAREAKLWSDRRSYASEMKLASVEAEAGQMGLVHQRLREQRPQSGREVDLRGFEWYYLHRLRYYLRTLEGHAGAVTGVGFSPDGRRLASASEDQTVRVWEAATGQERFILRGHTKGVRGVAFSPDGRHLASASQDQTVKVWDAAAGKEVLTLKGHTSDVFAVAYSPDGRRLASVSGDRTVRVWDAAGGDECLILHGHTSRVTGVAYSPDGRRLASASWDGTVRIWDAATGQWVRSLSGHVGQVYSVAYSPDGRRLASAGQDDVVRIWDAAAGQEILTLKGHTNGVTSVAYSSDGQRIASASSDQTVKVWDTATGQEILTLKGHTNGVTGVTYSPDGRCLASSGGMDETVKIWDTATGLDVPTLKGHMGQVTSVAYSPDGRRLASASDDQTVMIWDTATGQDLLTLKGHTSPVWGVAYSPDGRCLASASHDWTVKIWDAATGQNLRTFKGHPSGVWGVAYSPDGRCLASAGHDGTVKIWDADTGENLRTLRGHTHPVRCVLYSPDGRHLVSASQDGTVKIWDADTGRHLLTLEGHAYPVTSLAYSPDGRYLASACHDGTVKVWDTATGQESLTLRGHTAAVRGLAYSPDGRRLASAGEDRTVKIWEAATGQECLTLKEHLGHVYGVAFSPDGQRLASCSQDWSVKIWDATPVAPQWLIEREARGLVQFLFARLRSPEEVANSIRRDPTIGEAVCHQALARVEPFWHRQIRHEAARFIAPLFSKALLRHEVLAAIRADDRLREPVRREALTLAETFPENADALNEASWTVVRQPSADAAAYQQALRQAEAAYHLAQHCADYANTLGVAYYRAGRYPEALAALEKSILLGQTSETADDSCNLYFLAMCHQRLGNVAKARECFARAIELQELNAAHQSPAQNQELKQFRSEAQALLEKPAAGEPAR